MEMTAMKNIEKRENYEIPEVSVVEFKTEDVLTVSGGGDGIVLPDDEIEG